MPVVTDCYVSLEDIKTRLGGNTIDGGDPALEAEIVSACRAIDMHCKQTFTTATVAVARTFEPVDAYTAYIDPCHEAPTIITTDSTGDATFASTWVAADYELGYFGGDWGQSISAPYDTIRAVGGYLFPTTNLRRRSLRVTAKWGWAAPPQNVVEATRILSVDLWKRKDTAFGIATGSIDFGPLRIGRDALAQVVRLLDPFVRRDRDGIA